MDVKGLNFSCSVCHTTISHEIDGRHYDAPAPGKRHISLPKDEGHRIRCEACHGSRPHRDTKSLFNLKYLKLNDHTDRVACQTCHIPFYARGLPTNIYWDWSTAGRFKNGKPIIEKGPLGRPIYHTKKGTLKWGKDLIPEYLWYNGTMSYLLPGEPLRRNENGQVVLIAPVGGPDDPASRIFPFKPHFGRQPYDPVRNTMVIPKLFGPKGSGAFWAEYNWQKAVAAGMSAAGLPFSGEVGFIDTVYYLPLSHMIPPKEKSLKCNECHVRYGGRLAKIEGIYIPGRDYFVSVDKIGRFLCLLVFSLVLVHGIARIIISLKRKHK